MRALLLALWGCAPGTGSPVARDTGGAGTASTSGTTGTSPTTSAPCTYPVGAVEPMAVGEVLTPHSWPDAVHRDGRTASIDLIAAPCNVDDDIDWSPFDVLLFVSFPIW